MSSLIGAAALLAACRSTDAGHVPTPAPSASGATSTKGAELDPLTHGWEAERQYVYDLNLATTVTFASQSTPVDFTIDAAVQVVPAKVSPERVTLYMTFDTAHIVSRVEEAQADLNKTVQELRASGCFSVVAGGQITEMRLSAGLSPVAANMYREIAAALQFSGSTAHSGRYNASEYDTTGRYLAEYQQVGAASSWQRRKLRYLHILRGPNTPVTATQVIPQIVSSVADLQLAPSGRPEHVHAVSEVLIDGAQVPIRSKTTIALDTNRVGELRAPIPDWDGLLAQTKTLQASEPIETASAADSLDDARIHGLTFARITSRLDQIAKERRAKGTENRANEAVGEEDTRLFVALAAIFRKDPNAVAQAVAVIRKGAPCAASLIEALGSSSSPSAQSALITLMKTSSLDEAIRNQASAALTRAAKPGPDSIEALKAILQSDPFNVKALFGIGSYCRRLRDAGDLGTASKLGELLRERLTAASEVAQLITALRALTNAGYDGALPDVQRYLLDDRAEVRVAAIRSLQSMRSPQVDDLLAHKLTQDTSPEVKVSALDAAQVRPPSDSLVAAITQSALNAHDPRVRYRAVELLAQWLPARNDVRSTLEQVAERDGEAQVRERAKVAL